MPRLKEESLNELNEQLAALKSSNAAYDAGEVWEAKRLATTAYTLLHDGRGRTKSLLSQLGILDQMEFLASAPPINPDNLASDFPLVIIRMTVNPASATYLPRLEDGPPLRQWLPFADWWAQIILKDQRGLSLTRKDLVLTLRDQEGGSHFDAELTNPAYISAKEGNMGWVLVTPEGSQSIDPGPQFATMRQIAWELEQSINN